MSIQHWQFELGGGVSIELRAKGDIAINDTPELRLSLQAHLPGYSPQALGVPNLFIGLCQREDDEEGWAVRRGKNREYVIINSRFDDSLQKDLPHILYHAARIEWLKRGIFPAHAACVGTEEEGYVLIMGPSGAGKTSATLECAQGWGLEVFSGDKTLLFPTSETSLIALSGTQVLTTRGADHEAWGDLIKSSTPLGGRHAVVIDDVWKSESPFVRIKGIVMLALGHDHQDVWERIDQPMYSLYPYLIDSERADLLLEGGNCVIPAPSCEASKAMQATKLAKCIRNLPVYMARGSLENVCSRIYKLVTE